MTLQLVNRNIHLSTVSVFTYASFQLCMDRGSTSFPVSVSYIWGGVGETIKTHMNKG